MSDNTTKKAAKRLVSERPSRMKRFLGSHFWHSFKTDRVAQISFLLFLTAVIMALCAPILAPFDPYDLAAIDIMDSEIPPSWKEGGDSRFWLGTDAQGRDMWSTILYGTRLSLMIGICAVLLQAFSWALSLAWPQAISAVASIAY